MRETMVVSSDDVNTHAPTLEVRLLGDFEIYRDGEPIRLPQSKKTRALLAYLILTGRPQKRSRLCSLLWDVADDPRAALRWSLSKIRPLVNSPDVVRITTDGDLVAFEPAGSHVDILELREVLSGGASSLSTERLREVVDGHRGELLESLDMNDFDEFQAWSLGQREQTRLALADALRTLIARLEGSPAEAIPYAFRLVEAEPVDEQVRAKLVELLGAAGRGAEAQQQYEAGKRQLTELGATQTGTLAAAWRTLGDAAPAPLPTAPNDSDLILISDSPLIGRAAERAHLDRIVDDVRSGAGERVVLLSGEPGVGKTRLLISLLESARKQSALVLEGRAFEAERGRPYGPWIDAIRSSPIRQQAMQIEHLRPLLADEAGEHGHTRSQMFTAVVDLFYALAREHGLLVVALDDVQWIDEASSELLHYLARQQRKQPMLLALTARGGEIVDNEHMQTVLRGLRSSHTLEELEVGPLSSADTAALIAELAPNADAEAVYTQSSGNPLFALELARSGAADDALPATVAEAVRARVDRLPSKAQELLRWAAVFGPKAPIGALSEVTSLSSDELMTALEHLEKRALLLGNEDVYAFAHDVVRQAIVSELSSPRRRLMHRQIAQVLERTRGDAADIAHHASLGGDELKAAHACVAAATRSLKLFASQDALALARRARRYSDSLEHGDRIAIAIDCWRIELAARTPENADEVGKTLEALAEEAIDCGREEHARRAFHLLGYLRWERGRSADAARHMLHAEQLTRRSGDDARRAEALAEAAQCLVLLDRDLGHAEALALEARAVANRAGIEVPVVPGAVGLLRHHQGKVDDALSLFREANALARRRQDRLGEFHILEQEVRTALCAHRLDVAESLCERLGPLGEKLREGSEAPYARAVCALLAYARDADAARLRLDAATEELRVVDAKQRLSFILLMAAELDLRRERAESARTLAADALPLVRVLRLRSDTIWAQALLARAAMALDDPATADELLTELREADLGPVAAYARRAVEDVLNL